MQHLRHIASLRATVAVGFALAASLTGAIAQSRVSGEGASIYNPRPGQAGQRLTLPIGKSIIVDLPRDAAEVFVGNPKVANAVVRSARKLFIVAVDNGQTNVFALDKDGQRIAAIEITTGRDVGELQQLLRTAMPGVAIDVKTVGDSIILTGMVDSAIEAQKAYDIANAFVGYTVASGAPGGADSVSFNSVQIVNGKLVNALTIRGKDQVMLKVTIAEVQRHAIKQLGVSSSLSWGTAGTTASASDQFFNNPLALQANQPSSGYNAFAWQTGLGRLRATLQAFERNGVARVLAEPTVAAISGEAAKFTAGGEIPVPITENCSTTNGVTSCQISRTYKPYGVSLNFTPVVLSEGRIQLHIATEVSEMDGNNGGNGANVNFPAFRTRKNETTVELPSGGSIVSAGLIQQKSRQIINGQPALMNLPILGALFRSRDFQKEETELMMIVTPYIAKTLRQDQIARPDDGFADASDPQSVFLGRVNRIYATKRNPEIIQSFKGRVGFIND